MPSVNSLALLVLEISLKVRPIFKGHVTQAGALLGKILVILFKFTKTEQCTKYQVSVIAVSHDNHRYSVQHVLNANCAYTVTHNR